MTPAPFAAQLEDLAAALGRPFDVPESARYKPEEEPRKVWRVRVARSGERKRSAVMRGVPDGSRRAESQGSWLRTVQDCPDLGGLRADTWASTWAVAQLLAWTADWASLTTRPTLDVLVERSGRSRATVGRALRRLRAAGLLGIVAKGRSAEYSTTKGGGAEAAVYVLAEPMPLPPVDEHEHPTPSGDAGNPSHACAREANDSSAALRARPSAPAARCAPVGRPGEDSGDPPADRAASDELDERPTDRGTWVPLRPDERRRTADELQARLPVLRRISARHVAWIVRPWAEAGWSSADLAEAIDRRPDGTRWPHDGADGVGNVGAWLAYRLTPWRTPDGAVRPSPAQREAAAARERIARQVAERAAAPPPASSTSPALAAIRTHLATRRGSR